MQFLLKKKMLCNIFPGALKSDYVYLALPISSVFLNPNVLGVYEGFTDFLVYTAIPSKKLLGFNGKTYNVFGKESTIQDVLNALKHILKDWKNSIVDGDDDGILNLNFPLLVDLREYTLDEEGLLLDYIDPADQKSNASSSRGIESNLYIDEFWSNEFKPITQEEFWSTNGTEDTTFKISFMEQHPTALTRSYLMVGLDENENIQFRCCPILKVTKSNKSVAYIMQWVSGNSFDMKVSHPGDLNMADAFGASFDPSDIIGPGGIRVDEASPESGTTLQARRKYQLKYKYEPLENADKLEFKINNTTT